LAADAPSSPLPAAQFFQDLKLMDYYLKDLPALIPESSLIYYYTMGEEAWRITRQWPPEGHQRVAWFLGEAGSLVTDAPVDATGEDVYNIDYEHTTGVNNRWYTQLGGGDVVYTNREAAAEQLLVYTSEPLSAPLELTGHPVVRLNLAVTDTAGMVFVYIETIKPDGEVLYLTEGQLNLAHRKEKPEKPWKLDIPFHSFRSEDILPVIPGEPMEVNFALLPMSVKIPEGYRLRIAIGGQDKDTFARYPATGNPSYTVYRNGSGASLVELPVIQ